MSNALKSKYLLGVVILAATVVAFTFALAMFATKASADCSITTTLRLGSRGVEVQCLQSSLGGLVVDGSFGPKTKAAAMTFQSSHGLVADGVFGPLSRAAWMGGSMSSGGGSSNGCLPGWMFNPTTGQSCGSSSG